MKRRILAGTLSLMMVLTGCSGGATISEDSINLMDGVDSTREAIDLSSMQETGQKEEITQFSIDLFHETFVQGENSMISPLSIVSALAMTANGAEGNTLTQMEEVFHGDIAGMNEYLKAYIDVLPNEDAYKVNVANSIWMRDSDSLTVRPDFLALNKDYYDAGMYKAPFDETTRKDINTWVDENTDGMIDHILDEPIPKAVMLYLINAILFDAKWENPYKEHQVRDGIFTTEDGTTQDIKMMSSEEFSYLESDTATGMMRYYEDSEYAFVALLPDEGLAMEDFLQTLDGERLRDMMDNYEDIAVQVKIPKFTAEYSINLNNPLQAMGMTDAFDMGAADFAGMATSSEGNLFISEVIHKTKIVVNEQGTKAAAATLVAIEVEGAPLVEEPKAVFLDRPFFYMIVDTTEHLPLFMGVMMDMQ